MSKAISAEGRANIAAAQRARHAKRRQELLDFTIDLFGSETPSRRCIQCRELFDPRVLTGSGTRHLKCDRCRAETKLKRRKVLPNLYCIDCGVPIPSRPVNRRRCKLCKRKYVRQAVENYRNEHARLSHG